MNGTEIMKDVGDWAGNEEEDGDGEDGMFNSCNEKSDTSQGRKFAEQRTNWRSCETTNYIELNIRASAEEQNEVTNFRTYFQRQWTVSNA